MSSSVSIADSSTVTASSGTVSSSSSTSDLASFESFVEILCVQLQNQDPTDPVENTELVSQLAQMSSLQQLGTIGDSLEAYQAYGLIDKNVTYNSTDSAGTTTTASGTVTAVKVSSGDIYLTIGGASVSFDDVVGVNSTASTTTTTT